MDHNQPKYKRKHLSLFNRLCLFQSRQDWTIEVPTAYGFLLNLICSLGICRHGHRDPESYSLLCESNYH